MADRDDPRDPPSELGLAPQPSERDVDPVRFHLSRAWQSFAPAPDLHERVRARLTSSSTATLGALGLGAATGAGRPSPWLSLQASGKVGALVGVGLLGVGFLSGYLARSSPNAPPAPAPVVAVSAPVPPVPERALAGLAGLEQALELHINDNPSLESLHGIESLAIVGRVSLTENDALTDVAPLAETLIHRLSRRAGQRQPANAGRASAGQRRQCGNRRESAARRTARFRGHDPF